MEKNTARPLPPPMDEGAVGELPVAGMTCASCVVRVERALERVPGVAEATVNYATQRARVRFTDGYVAYGTLARAVEDAGYSVPGTPTGTPAEETLDLGILGMTCAACVRRVEKALGRVPGVLAATVNLATNRATVTIDPAVTTGGKLVAAVREAGYDVAGAEAFLGEGADGASGGALRGGRAP
ncbi:MAG: heavy-metal-associated domain-containing protein, partial [Myxococcota bacterium]